jgi:TatD DNase family protein
MFVDAHSHVDMYSDEDLIGVLAAIDKHRILTFGVSIDVDSFHRAEAIAAGSGCVVPAFGIHPSEASRYVDTMDELEELAIRSPLLGEIGLDYRFVTDETLYPAQRHVFRWMLDHAHGQGKLVSVHCAGAERDTADLLAGSGVERAIIHWYSGPLDVLSRMIEMGLMFSVGPAVLQSDHIRQVARAVPEGQLLTETDNPGGPRWLTGEAGYPGLIRDVVDELARIRDVTPDELASLVRTNTVRLIEGDEHLRPWSVYVDN